jgi:5-formyltetrahydrofolate cyclo-ligase
VPAPETDPKTVLRKRARDIRARAHARFGTRYGPIMAANFFAGLSYPTNAAVAGYWPTGEEADPRPLLNALVARGHDVALPRMVGEGAPVRFLSWRPGDGLEAGPFGIEEPTEDRPEVDPNVVLVPLLVFDGTGLRLGYGGGYYDRTLAALRQAHAIEAVGIAYADQEVDSLPAGDHDERLDWIVTERGCRRFAAPPKASEG